MAADPRDLVTLSDAMAWLGVTNASEDVTVQDLITNVSLDFLRYTGRGTLNSILPFNETYDGSGSQRQFLKNGPILQVVSLSINGRQQAPSTSFGVAGYLIDQDRKSLSLRGGSTGSGSFSTTTYGGWGPFFRKGIENIAVSYFAGYSLMPAEPQQIPASPGPYTVTVTNAAQFVIDMGVTYQQTGIALVPVASSPAQGQYTVTSAGQYTFNAADASLKIVISYGYNGAPEDLQVACKRVLSLRYKRKPQEDLKSKIMAEGGTAVFQSWEFPLEIKRTLDNYKRRAVV